jgi:hypothetical protein
MREIVRDRQVLDLPPATSIPTFASELEEAEFWSTHDTSLIFEDGEDVSGGPPPDVFARLDDGPRTPARRRPKPGEMSDVAVQLPAETVDVLHAVARRRAISLDSLLAEWLGDRIEEERRRRYGDLALVDEREPGD